MAAAAVWWEWWEASAAMLSVIALVLQIIGVDATTLLRLADSKLLRLRPCRLQCAKLKRRTSDHQALLRRHHHHLHRLHDDDDDDEEEVQATIQAATHLIDSYNNSSLFHIIRSSRCMERDMARMRDRVDAACCSLSLLLSCSCIIHAPTSAQTYYYYLR